MWTHNGMSDAWKGTNPHRRVGKTLNDSSRLSPSAQYSAWAIGSILHQFHWVHAGGRKLRPPPFTISNRGLPRQLHDLLCCVVSIESGAKESGVKESCTMEFNASSPNMISMDSSDNMDSGTKDKEGEHGDEDRRCEERARKARKRARLRWRTKGQPAVTHALLALPPLETTCVERFRGLCAQLCITFCNANTLPQPGTPLCLNP
ncbi:hypothetical protein HU200_048695 [Digitaria exilis]|uniref:Uncharacterized protein n=1 Tax=Digitaria exilis TaxID=1010633 RepID=A0A835E8W1_9POAL|nr:hypothetical protein HU200_048695 [Digitaria exilis]